MKRITLALFTALGGVVASVPAEMLPTAVHSFSGQFIAHAPRVPGAVVMPPDLQTNASALELQPELLTVSAERIKQSIWLELGTPATGRDKIHLSLRPARSAADIVDVSLERFKSSWGYHVELPAVMEREKYVRAMISVILLEIANRSATDHAAEVPAWLTEGLTQRLLETRGNELMLPPPRNLPGGLLFTPTILETRRHDPTRVARQEAQEHPPLTVEELSWPTEAQLNGPDQDRYRQSAGLFVTELQLLPGGRDALRAMLGGLGSCYNWQTAFHQAFASTFPRPLDLEKWWTLQIAHLNGRDPDRFWTTKDSLRKLDELLKVPIGIRQDQTDLPASGLASLQSMIQEWDALRQIPVLKTKLTELDGARLRVAHDVIKLVDDYRQTLATYLRKRNGPGFAFVSGKNGPPAVQQLTRDTVRALDELDRRRAELMPAESTAPPSPQN